MCVFLSFCLLLGGEGVVCSYVWRFLVGGGVVSRAPKGEVPCYMLYGFSMGLLYAIAKHLTLL